jgi:hypothetical protein
MDRGHDAVRIGLDGQLGIDALGNTWQVWPLVTGDHLVAQRRIE